VTNLLDKEYVSACDYWCYYGNRRAIIGTLGNSR
jgi:iron complex outermembrane receptor protein